MKFLLLFVFWLGLVGSFGVHPLQASKDGSFSDKVNLSLRQVGHQLLTMSGDSISTIPPVEMTAPFSFRLILHGALDYDTLPQLVHQALSSFQIENDYNVVVKSCEDNLPILGYNMTTFNQGNIPCMGREHTSECSIIVISFMKPFPYTADKNFSAGGILILIGISILAYYVFQLKFKHDHPVGISGSPENTPLPLEPSILSIGAFNFDHSNQMLQIGASKKSLTFRESKLLLHFAQHQNEIMSREMLIDKVWGEEGVLVRRSLDVFVSRLRKLLQADKNVSIINIHSVGYRLEVH